jgi:hypothetical protein
MDLSYILNELGEDRDDYFRAVAPPIMQTSNFVFKKVDDLRKSFEDEYSTWLYSRGLNPTVEILRKKLAALDGAEDCLVFNSGAAAIFASVLANVKSGDHIVSVRNPYTWARKMFDVILPRFNVSVTYIDGTRTENFSEAINPIQRSSISNRPTAGSSICRIFVLLRPSRSNIILSPSAITVIAPPFFRNRLKWGSTWFCNQLPNISADTAIRLPAY